VWAAIDTETNEPVALKLLKAEAVARSDARGRLRREGRIAAALSHPNLVRVHGIVEDAGGTPAIVMELLEGESLADHLQRERKLTLSQTAHVLLPALMALKALHARGLIHRDLKPANIFLSRSQTSGTAPIQVKLLDLGLVKALGLGKPGVDTATLTVSGMMVGTPHYMAPEQILSEPNIDQRVDVFAAGVVLHECLAGVRPTEAENLGQVLKKVLSGNFPSLTEACPGCPPEVADLVKGMLAREPGDRADSLDSAIALLTRYADVSDTIEVPVKLSWSYRARRAAVGVGALLGVALVGGAGAVVLNSRPPPCAQKLAGMACIPAGTFTMGSTAEQVEADCRALGPACVKELLQREQPARRVKLSEFYLDEHEVTNAEFVKWLNRTPERIRVEDDGSGHKQRYVLDYERRLLLDLWPSSSGIELSSPQTFRPRPGMEQWPTVLVTWEAANSYCKALGKRLPTEAEWERAARGQANRLYPWGNEKPRCPDVVLDRVQGGTCQGLPAQLAPADGAVQDRTPEGILNLGGNASEWVFDAFTLPYYGPCGDCVNPRVDVPAGSPGGEWRVFRGGAFWKDTLFFSRSTARGRWKREEGAVSIGFRCAVDSAPP